MYRHVCTVNIHIYTSTYVQLHILCTWYKQVQIWYVQVQPSCTGKNMSVHGSDMSLPFCQILPGFGKNLCWYVLVCTILMFLVRPCIEYGTYWLVPVHTILYCLVPGVKDSRCPVQWTMYSQICLYMVWWFCWILSRWSGFQMARERLVHIQVGGESNRK